MLPHGKNQIDDAIAYESHNPMYTEASLITLNEEKCNICCASFKGKYVKPVSTKVLTLPCDHPFHKSCVYDLLETRLEERKNNINCPTCSYVVDRLDIYRQPKYNNIDELHQSLQGTCSNKSCEISGTFREIKNHQALCPSISEKKVDEIIENSYPQIKENFNSGFSAADGFMNLHSFTHYDRMINNQKICVAFDVSTIDIDKRSMVKRLSFTIGRKAICKAITKKNQAITKEQVEQALQEAINQIKAKSTLEKIGGVCNKYTNTHISKIDSDANILLMVINGVKKELPLDLFFNPKECSFDFILLREHLGAANFMDLFSNELVTQDIETEEFYYVTEDGSLFPAYYILEPDYGCYYAPGRFYAEGAGEGIEMSISESDMQQLITAKKTPILDLNNLERLGQKSLDDATKSELERLKYLGEF